MSEPESLDVDEGSLPEEVADAWATVLLDLWEKEQAAAKQAQAGSVKSQDGTSTNPGRMNDSDSCTDA
jgi:hypothetical protein